MKNILESLSAGAAILAVIFHFIFNGAENHIYIYAEIVFWILSVILEQMVEHRKPLALMGEILFVCGFLMNTLTLHKILSYTPLTLSLTIVPIIVGLLLVAHEKAEYVKYFVTYLLPIVFGITAIFICLFGITADPVNPYLLALGIFLWIGCFLSVFILIKKERTN